MTATTDRTAGQAPGVGRVARLAAEAADGARVRALTTHPDVIALRVEKVRTQVDALLWAGIVLGLAFTMVNVQAFAAAGAAPFTSAWWVAWLLDPMVSLVLLAVLRAEQVTARYQVPLPAWGRITKWLTFAATYLMNTWTSWGLADKPLSWSGVVLHSVPPLVVFATAETGPGLRDRLTEAVHKALAEHTHASEPVGPLAAPAAAPVFSVDAERVAAHEVGLLDEHGLSREWDDAPPAEPTRRDRVEQLIAAGVGRRRLSRELDISEYRARRLLDRTRGAEPSTDQHKTAHNTEQDTGADAEWAPSINGSGGRS